MNLEQQAKNVAAQGRYGDSMLMHVNPAEVKGLAQAMPITINPETGQPEAFLPFLAPIIGSMLGSAFLPTVIPALAGKTLLASAIGSGLAQTAATGDIKKGLLAGITGYGIGSALQGAGAAAAGTEAAGAQTAQLTQDATANLLQDPSLVAKGTGMHAMGPFPAGTTPPVGALNPAGQAQLTQFMSTPQVQQGIGYAGEHGFGVAGTPNFIQGSKDYLAGNPTLGQAFKDAGGFSKEGFKNLLTSASDPMTILPIAGGMAPTAIMESQEQFEADIARRERQRKEEEERIWRENPEMIPVPVASGGKLKLNTNNYFAGGGIDEMIENVGMGIRGGDLGSYTGQGYVQERTPVPIDPYFQAGFQPEMSYFETLNPAASVIGGPPTPELPTKPPLPANESQTAVSRSMPAAPTRFDPTQTAGYQSFYGDAAQDVIPNVVDPYAPVDFSPPPRLPSPIMPPTPPIGPILPPEDPTVPPVVPPVMPPVINPIMPTPKGSPVLAEPFETFESGQFSGFENGQGASIPESLLESSIPQLSIPELSLPPDASAPDLPVLDTSDPSSGKAILDYYHTQKNDPNFVDYGKTFDEFFAANYGSTAPATATETTPLLPMSVEQMEREEQLKRNVFLPPTDRAKGGTTNYQEGRETQMNMDDPVVQGVINFLLGNSFDESIIPQFIEMYGVEAFQQLRRQVLNEVVPQAQTEGQIQGNNQGGMADDIGGMIGNKERVAVSQDEYIVPADVVSMLGDGSSDSGAAKLDTMLDRVRQAKTGKTTQAAPLKKDVLPA